MAIIRLSVMAMILVVMSFAPHLANAQGAKPVVEYSTLLSAIDVYPTSGKLNLGHRDQPAAAFLPQGANVDAVLTKKGSPAPLYRVKIRPQPLYGAFTELIPSAGQSSEFVFQEEGDYVLTYRVNGRPMTEFPFKVFLLQSDDPFDPQRAAFMKAPWDHWAQVFLPRKENSVDSEGSPEFRIWMHRPALDMGSGSDEIHVEIHKDGDPVADGGTSHVSGQMHQNMRFRLKHPEPKGGEYFKTRDLLRREGIYHVVVTRNGQLHGVYAYEVKRGQVQLHPRQQPGNQPHTGWLISRYAGEDFNRGGAGDIIWTERIEGEEAQRIAARQTADVAGPSAADRQRWTWAPKDIDPQRPFELVVTDVETRSDTMISAGEDLIAFGTGFPTGVKYLIVGETAAREIPDGETYSSRVFRVCGKKIVLVKKQQVVIFDTETGRLFPISAEDVSLYDVRGGLHNANLLNADGYLVGTVNKATAVKDRTILKVIDLSGDQPRIIPIKNANYVDSDVSSISLDASAGAIAVSSQQKKQVAVAKIAPQANQHVFDLADYRGVSRHQIFIEDDRVIYADSDWKVRLLDLNEGIPKAVTDQPIGASSNGFFVRQGRLVVATTERFGSRCHFAISDLPARPRTLAETGQKIPDTSGGLGMAGCAAIALDTTVFLAGTPSGGIGAGEHLQVLDKSQNSWVPLENSEGKVVTAIDVTTSRGLAAFKSADRDGKTTVGYVTYGERIILPAPTKLSTTSPTTAEPSPVTTAPLKLEQDNTYHTKDEQAESLLQAYLENEILIAEAFVQAFGEEAGKKRAIDTTLQAIQAAGEDHLIDEYKRRSSLITAEDKPKPEATHAKPTTQVDPVAIRAALHGQWYALRFVVAGDELSDEAVESAHLTFGGDQYVRVMGGNIETGTYEFDSSARPFTITIHIGNGKNKGQSRQGAFKLLEEDRLMMVFSTKESDLATKFVSTKADQQILAVYRKK